MWKPAGREVALQGGGVMAGKTAEIIADVVKQALIHKDLRIQMMCASDEEARLFINNWRHKMVQCGAMFSGVRTEFVFPNGSVVRIVVVDRSGNEERVYGTNPDQWLLSRFLEPDIERRIAPLFREKVDYIDPRGE